MGIISNIITNLRGGPPEYRALLKEVEKVAGSGDFKRIAQLRSVVNQDHAVRLAKAYYKTDSSEQKVAMMELMTKFPHFVSKTQFYEHLGLPLVGGEVQLDQMESIINFLKWWDERPNLSIVILIPDNLKANLERAKTILANAGRGTAGNQAIAQNNAFAPDTHKAGR